MHGGFASHVRVPARGLCPVPDLSRTDLNPGRLTLEMLSVIADAVSTPYQAIVRSGLAPGDLAVFVGAGGVGGFGVQIAARPRRDRRRDRRRRRAARRRWRAAARRRRSTRRQREFKQLRRSVRGAGRRATHSVVAHEDLRNLGHAGRPVDRVRPARRWRVPVDRRLHAEGRRGPALEPHGVRCDRSGQLGLPAGALPGGPRSRPRRPRRASSRSSSGVRWRRSTTSSRSCTTDTSARRIVLIPES